MKHTKITVALLCCAVAAVSFGGCSKKESSSEAEPSTAESSIAVSSEAASETTETAVTTTSAAASTETTTVPETSEASVNGSEDGYTDCMSIANAFYNAYIEHDAEAVYALFNKEEIESFCRLIEPELDGKSADELFRKAAVIRSIESSMDNVQSIMDSHEASTNDKWIVVLAEKDIKAVDEDKLAEFNESLGMSYTSAAECRFVFYTNETNNDSFTGNSSAYMEKDGKWYLSFSNAMGTDLLNYIDLD